VTPLSLFPPERLPVGLQLFNQLIDKLGQAPRISFTGYQLAKPSPFLFLLDRHERI
jgi:hypothetical protein